MAVTYEIGCIVDNIVHSSYSGQGQVYKNEKNLLNTIDLNDEEIDNLPLNKKIVYIPENCFNSDGCIKLDTNLIDGSDYYTVKSIKEDIKTYLGEDVFKKIADKDVKDMLLDVFEALDWQHPYSLIEGDGYLDEFVKELGIDLDAKYEI